MNSKQTTILASETSGWVSSCPKTIPSYTKSYNHEQDNTWFTGPSLGETGQG